MKTKFIAIVLAIVLIIPMIPLYAEANEGINHFESDDIKRLITINSFLNKSVREIVELHDFDGNLYHLVTLEENGYYIYDATTGILLECSEDSANPYDELLKNDISDNLFYCGATYYYYYDIDKHEYIHTILKWESIDEKNEVLLDKFKQASNRIHNACIREKNNNQSKTEGAHLRSLTLNSTYYSPGYSMFLNLTTDEQIGYWTVDETGCCGFIAAGLLLYWFNNYYNYTYDIINPFSFLKDNPNYAPGDGTYKYNGFIGPDFTRYLLTLGDGPSSSGDGTFADSSIEDVIESYFSRRCINGNANVDITLSASNAAFILRTQSKPVIVFGSLNNPKNNDSIFHAVLCYGAKNYTESNPYFGNQSFDMLIAHFGWPNIGNYHFEQIEINPIALGQTLSISDLSVTNPTISDVTSGWALPAVRYCIRYGIMDYASTTYFQPSEAATRSVFVNALYQLAGAPKVNVEDIMEVVNQFSDVTLLTKYLSALAWSYREGILFGTTNTTISPNDTLKRQQAAAFIHRYAQNSYLALSFLNTSGPAASTFVDYSDISNYAVIPMDYCTRRYIFQGDTLGYLHPRDTLTRAQTAQLIYAISNAAKRGN